MKNKMILKDGLILGDFLLVISNRNIRITIPVDYVAMMSRNLVLILEDENISPKEILTVPTYRDFTLIGLN